MVGDGQRFRAAKSTCTNGLGSSCVVGFGHWLMASPTTHQVHPPAGALQTPQVGDIVPSAHRTRSVTSSVKMATWKVRSMVDTEGPIEVASQFKG